MIGSESVSLDDTGYRLYIDPVFKSLIVSFDTTNILNIPLHKLRDLVSNLETISKESTFNILNAIVERHAATSFTLETETEVTHATLFRSLRELLKLGLIVKAAPLRTGRGNKSTIYAIPEYEMQDLQRAVHDDKIIRTPGYAECERLGQLVITDYLDYVSREDGHIQRERVHEVMRKECHGFRWFDLKREVEGYIFRKGFKLI